MPKIAWLQEKPPQFYRGIRIKADTGLHEEIAEVVLGRVSSGAKLLDLGAGEGALSQRLTDLGYDVTASDLDGQGFRGAGEFLELDLNSRERTEQFVRENLEKFDLVLCVEVIEHVENPWQLIRDMAAMLKPRGFLLVSTPNVTSWYSRVNFLLRGRFHQFEDSDRAYGHINPVADDELRLICESTGMNVIEVRPGGWLPRLWLTYHPLSMARNFLGFLASFLMKGPWDGWCIILLAQKKAGNSTSDE